MTSDSGRPKHPWRFSLKGLLLLILVVAAALSGFFHYRAGQRNHQLAEELRQFHAKEAAWRYELDLRVIEADLKVPTEALYGRYMPRGRIDQLRWEAFEKFGVQEFVPYYYVHSHRSDDPLLHGIAPAFFRLKNWENNQDSFWEGFAINHADDGCEILIGKLQHDEGFRRYLEENPEIFQKRLRPALDPHCPIAERWPLSGH